MSPATKPLGPSKIKHITRDELRKFMQREDPSATEELVKGPFDLMDKNKDGNVSKEFLYRYTENRKRFMVSHTDHQCVNP